MVYFGIDLGGTKTECIALDEEGNTLARRRRVSPREDYEATIKAVAGDVTWLESETGKKGLVGIGIPGCISPATGLVKNANSTWLNGKPLDADVAEAIGRAVRTSNDANCFALSEAVDGAGHGFRTVWGIIIGTGSGSGLVVDGKVLMGPNGNAGEYGHIRLPDPSPDELPGEQCYCGQRGCVELWVSGPGLASDHLRRTKQDLTAGEIAKRSETGDADAMHTLDLHAHRLARAMAAVINIVDPDIAILGGGLSKMPHLYDRLPGYISNYLFAANPAVKEPLRTIIRPPVYGDASGVRGAAWLWRE